MTSLTLIIGNKNYSSWSLRPWLVLRNAGIPFEEIRIPLYTPESVVELLKWSPSGKVPALHDGESQVWDSLAICEYLADRFPDKHLWPDDSTARANARSISAEMHAGFNSLREHMSMNIRARHPNQGRTAGSLADIARITEIWTDCRTRFSGGGAFLFGRFGIADAMYAPVVLRFLTYGVELTGVARDYANSVLALPALQEWVTAATTEIERIDTLELYE
ncbi:MAG: glutathione S-transferase family protein [Thiobacillus sp.]|nr:glutathione S-transferase family protein [Thiobacillus sp.]